MAELTFTLPYPPTANLYWRNFRGRMVVSEKARAYKEEVGWMVKGKVREPLSGDLYVRVRIFRPRKSGDLDNTLKVLLDALKGIVFHDDEQVVRIEADRFDDKANPRAEVTVEARLLSPQKRAAIERGLERVGKIEVMQETN